MNQRVSNRLLVHRWSDREDQPQLHMFGPDTGVALFDIASAANAKTTFERQQAGADFVPNAAIVNSDQQVMHWITEIPRKFRGASHFVNIEVSKAAISLICFRGEIFDLDRDTYALKRTGFYPHY
jgi:hypothetical protein